MHAGPLCSANSEDCPRLSSFVQAQRLIAVILQTLERSEDGVRSSGALGFAPLSQDKNWSYHSTRIQQAVPIIRSCRGISGGTQVDCKSPGPCLATDVRCSPPRYEEVMPLIQLVEILVVVGVVLWLVNRFIPMQRTIKSILNAVVVISVVLWLLNATGLLHSFSNIRIGT